MECLASLLTRANTHGQTYEKRGKRARETCSTVCGREPSSCRTRLVVQVQGRRLLLSRRTCTRAGAAPLVYLSRCLAVSLSASCMAFTRESESRQRHDQSWHEKAVAPCVSDRLWQENQSRTHGERLQESARQITCSQRLEGSQERAQAQLRLALCPSLSTADQA